MQNIEIHKMDFHLQVSKACLQNELNCIKDTLFQSLVTYTIKMLAASLIISVNSKIKF